MTRPPFSVVTFLWDDPGYRWNRYFKYGVEHVEKLARGVRRNLKMPHDFVLITDQDPKLFKEPDRIIPLWDDNRDMGGCYVRLKAFSKEMREIINEKFVWLDLDCVVIGPLDRIFDRDVDFLSWQDVNHRDMYCGSLMMMKAGARSRVWETFDREQSQQDARHLIGTDQAWISHCLGRGEQTVGVEDGVLSYGRHVRKRVVHHKFTASPIEEASIVFFHGQYDPSTMLNSNTRRGELWIREHWK